MRTQRPLIVPLCERVLALDGKRIGVFGLNPLLPYGRSTLRHQAGLAGSLTDPHAAAAEAVRVLRETCDLVVCISHLGLRLETELLQKVRGIDVCLGGHTHHRLDTPIDVCGATLIQAGCNGAYVGEIDIDSHAPSTGRLLHAWPVAPDAELEMRLEASAPPQSLEPIAQLPPFDGDPWAENRLANRLTDIVREAAGTDLAMLKANSILPVFAGGDFTSFDLHRCYPGLVMDEAMDLDTVERARLPGSAVREAFEHAVSDLPCDVHELVPSHARLPAHNLLHASGVVVRYDLSRPSGTRVVELSIDGRELGAGGTYTVATDGFLSNGYSGYRCLRGEWETIGRLREIVESGLANGADLPPVEGRLCFAAS